MRGLFAHGAFHLEAALLSAHALTAYGVGLPAFVLVRVVAPTFYARGDTATPVRATIVSVIVNIALKIALVWGLNFGAVGIALGTALAAWVNVGMLLYLANSRKLIRVHAAFWRSLGPIVAASVATGGAALGGVALCARFAATGRFADEFALAAAVISGVAGYALATYIFRRALPLGKLRRSDA